MRARARVRARVRMRVRVRAYVRDREHVLFDYVLLCVIIVGCILRAWVTSGPPEK